MKIKKWWQSKTHWFNLTSALSITSVILMYVNNIGLEPVLAGRLAMGLSLFQSLANLYLRQISSVKIGAIEIEEFTGDIE